MLSVNDPQYRHQQPTSTTINSHLNHNLPLLLSTRAQFLPLTTHVANCPYTGQVVNTWPSIVNSSKVVHTWQVVKISFKNTDDQITHVWQIPPGSHPGFYSLGAWEGEHSCDNKILFTAMLAFTTFLEPHLNIRLFCDNIPRMT